MPNHEAAGIGGCRPIYGKRVGATTHYVRMLDSRCSWHYRWRQQDRGFTSGGVPHGSGLGVTSFRRHRQASFVGRERELELLDGLWRDTRQGRPSFLVIEGEPGIGKTRLAEEFADRVKRAGARVLWGNCIALQEGGLPYAPFRQALRETTDDPGLRAAIDTAASQLSDLLIGPDELSAGDFGQSRRIGLFEALLGLLRDVAATRPLLLVIEDVHWADHTTLDLLTFLSHNLSAIPVLSMLTYRPQPASSSGGQDLDPAERQRNQALRDFLFGHVTGATTERLRLRALEERAIAQQIADLTDVAPRPSEVTEIAQRSGGNPLFVEEILTSRREGDGQLSPSLRQLLQRRVHGLPDEVREVLDVIAVAGQTVEYDLLRAVADVPRDALHDRLRRAIDADVLVEEPESGHYAFRHALVQEALYEDLLAGRRRELHRGFADVLVARQSYALAAPGAIARHWDLAGDAKRALRAYIQAADAAWATFGFADAARFLRRAYELWDQVDDPTTLTSMSWRHLANKAIEGAVSVEQPETVIGPARDALARAQSEHNARAVAYQRCQLGRVHWYAGDERQALAETMAAVQALADDEPSTEQAEVFALRGALLAQKGLHRDAAALTSRALDAAIHSGAPFAYRSALVTLGSVTARQGDLAGGLHMLDEADELARLRNDADEVMRIVLHRGRVLQAYARWHEAWQRYIDGLTAAPKYGMHQRYSWRFHVLAARMSFFLGRWSRADDEIVQARELISGAGATLPSLLVATGRFAEAEAFFGGEQSKWRSTGTGLMQVPEVPIEMAVWQRQFSEARGLAAAGLEFVRGSEDPIPEARLCRTALRAEADLAEAEPDERLDAIGRAEVLLDRLREMHARRPPRPDGFGQEIALLASTGEAEYQRLLGAPDPDAWATVVDGCDALDMPYPAAYARWRQAQALRYHGVDKAVAVQLQDQALETVERIGARPLREAIRGVAPRSAVGSSSGSRADLTPREQQVADLLTRGYTNREIAEGLVIAEGTASVHVSNVLRKLGVTSRTQAIAMLIRQQ